MTSASVAIAERTFDGVGPGLAGRDLDAALAVAARGDGLTFIAVRAPVIATSAIVGAWPHAPLVAWSSPADGIAVVGVGVAHELRGSGADRWSVIARAARAVRVDGAIVVDSRAFDGRAALDSIDVLGFARPRFLGGGAFAPSAADAAPWTGFGDAWFALPRWTYAHDGASAWLVLAVDANAARETARRHTELAAFRAAFAVPSERSRRYATSDDSQSHAQSDDSSRSALHGTRGTPTHANIDLWRAQVEAITSAIANGVCSKIVAARTCSISLTDGANGHGTIDARVLATLDARHADCFRVLVRPPGGGTLVAATPERLVRLDGDVIRCDALAGTVRLESPDAEARLRASDKDRREHAIVVDAIRGALEALGARVDAPSEPAIKTLRHVLHLHTPIRATAPRDPANPLHLLDLAARLHPTPAVGGTPTAFAVEWILDHEPVPRGWYASPVGWFDLDGNGELAVAIRSGVLVDTRAHLWAGAGIVAGSDPDRELAETELKLRAMLGALRGAEAVVP